MTDLKLGEGILLRRRQQGMTISALAAKTGLSRSLISSIEHGTANPSVATLGKIAAALGCELVIGFRVGEDGEG